MSAPAFYIGRTTVAALAKPQERRVDIDVSHLETRVGEMTIERRLAISDRRQADRRFTGEPISGWGKFR